VGESSSSAALRTPSRCPAALGEQQSAFLDVACTPLCPPTWATIIAIRAAVGLHGIVLSFCSVSFVLLRSAIVLHHRDNEDMVRYHRGVQAKNLYSLLLYVASVPLAFVDIRISFFIFVFVAVSYFLPERKLAES
jgi:hypothetical protein